jgi:hypothetical protein
VFGPALLGLAAAYVFFDALRAKYQPSAFLLDLACLSALCAFAAPQVLALWGRREGLVWLPTADYLTFLPSILPLAVPALVAVARPRATWPAPERALWMSAGAQVACLLGLAIAGTNLLAPRYLDVITVPLAIAGGLSLARVATGPRLIGLGYSVALTGLLAFTAYRATGQFTLLPQHDWRAATDALRQHVEAEPGPVLYRSGFVEQESRIEGRDSAMLAPLRSPGTTRPIVTLVSLPFSFDSIESASQRADELSPLIASRPVYLLSIADGYAYRFSRWVDTHLSGGRCQPLKRFRGVDLFRCMP